MSPTTIHGFARGAKNDSQDLCPTISQVEASGPIADLFQDIRAPLNGAVVNLVWRHLAAIAGALEWAWSTAKQLYLGPATGPADKLRNLDLPPDPHFRAMLSPQLGSMRSQSTKSVTFSTPIIRRMRWLWSSCRRFWRDAMITEPLVMWRPLLRQCHAVAASRAVARAGSMDAGPQGRLLVGTTELTGAYPGEKHLVPNVGTAICAASYRTNDRDLRVGSQHNKGHMIDRCENEYRAVEPSLAVAVANQSG